MLESGVEQEVCITQKLVKIEPALTKNQFLTLNVPYILRKTYLY
jgi:hypothetical protein